MTRFRNTLILLVLVCPGLAPAAEPPPDTLPKTPDSAKTNVSDLMETIGLLSSVQLYQTYLTIGMLADGRIEGTYTDDDLGELLRTVNAPLDRIERQLDKVAKIATDKDDREALQKLRSLTLLLRQQGRELETFWSSGLAADGEKYELTRRKAWNEIRVLTNLEDDTNPETAPTPRGSSEKR